MAKVCLKLCPLAVCRHLAQEAKRSRKHRQMQIRTRAAAAHFFLKITRKLDAYISLTSSLACWTTQRKEAEKGKGNLCRNLCRNPRIPTHVACSRVVSLGYKWMVRTTSKPHEIASASRSRSFVVARCFLRQRTVTAEAAGSSPLVPAIFSKTCDEQIVAFSDCLPFACVIPRLYPP